MTPNPGPVLAPTRPHRSYRHEAVLYRGEDDFLATSVPFVRAGVSAGQPVMVAVIEPRAERLRAELGSDAADVIFVDMADLGGNPARIIPRWQQFVDEHCLGVRPVRGIGEPVWAGRRDAEVVEAQLHEALLNLAVDPDTPLWLRCPYDVSALGEAVIEEAYRSHPIVVESDLLAGSRTYGGAHHAGAVFARDLPPPAYRVDSLDFGAQDLGEIRALVGAHAAAAGFTAERVWELALAVHEVAANSVRGGAGTGTLQIWFEPDSLVCEVRDGGQLLDPLVGRRRPGPVGESGLGLWLANQLCDLVQVRGTDTGAVIRLVSWL